MNHHQVKSIEHCLQEDTSWVAQCYSCLREEVFREDADWSLGEQAYLKGWRVDEEGELYCSECERSEEGD